ncbi:MAG TPA: outer membrane lipoprotein chaperone LolA [Gemmatimonadaceae bacterium]|nr:outer membrane lipoprotein chaperone LolA [Gemmatimonadaceae bacterium]
MSSHSVRLSLVMLAAAAAPLAAQSTTDKVLDRAVAAWGKVKTARATFEQTVTNSLTGSSANARGEFQQQRPNRLAIRFTEPTGDRIVSDGASVWVYLPSSAPGQVVKRSAADASALPLDITGEFLTDPRSRYDITDAGSGTVAGHSTQALLLAPKTDTRAPFSKATIWVDDDDGLIRQFEVVEGTGVTRRVRITSLELNVPVDRATFTFTPPPGVRVVDR